MSTKKEKDWAGQKKKSLVTPLLDEAGYSSDEDDEPLEWSQSGDFVHDVYVESDDEEEAKGGGRPQELSGVKTMLAPSLRRKKIPNTEKKHKTGAQPKTRKPKVRMKAPLPGGLPVQKGKSKKGAKQGLKKKRRPKKLQKSQIDLSDENLLASREYEQALRLHLANAEPYPEVDDDDDYSDHYIESESEYDTSYEEEEEEEGYGEEESSYHSHDAKGKYFSFSWDADKQPSGLATRFNKSPLEAEEVEEEEMHIRAPLRQKPTEDDDLHFSFTWSHKESNW